jgi:hypothetical protein
MDTNEMEEKSARAVAGIFCDTFKDLIDWMRWAHERNRPFHASTFEGELGFRIDIVLDYSETVEDNQIIRKAL